MNNIDITRLDNLQWRVAHMETGIYLDFKEGCFNDRQEAHYPADLADATTIARAMREIGDWCAQNVYSLCFCDREMAKRIVSKFSLADWAVLTSIQHVHPDTLDMELFAIIEDEGICASLGIADPRGPLSHSIGAEEGRIEGTLPYAGSEEKATIYHLYRLGGTHGGVGRRFIKLCASWGGEPLPFLFPDFVMSGNIHTFVPEK